MFEDLIIYTPMYVTFFWILVLLSAKSRNNQAKKFLGFFMVAAFLVYLSHAFFFKKKLDVYLFFDPVYTLASLSVYPMYYWYIKILTVDTELKWGNLRLLVPAVSMAFLSALFYLLMEPTERAEYLHSFLMGDKSLNSNSFVVQGQRLIYIVSRLIFACQVVFFLTKGRKLVIRYNYRIANFYSDLESKTIVWVNFLLYSFVITSVMSIVFNGIGRSIFLNSASLLLIPSLVFSALLFFIGLQGYMQNHTVLDLVHDEKQLPEKNLKNYNQAQLKVKLMELFAEQKIYKQPDLKITHVSSALHTNRTYISNLINQEFSCSFCEFVNEYRVKEARNLLQQKSSINYSLDYISETAGFGSLNSFIRVFKEHEKITPGRYRDKYRYEADAVKFPEISPES